MTMPATRKFYHRPKRQLARLIDRSGETILHTISAPGATDVVAHNLGYVPTYISLTPFGSGIPFVDGTSTAADVTITCDTAIAVLIWIS